MAKALVPTFLQFQSLPLSVRYAITALLGTGIVALKYALLEELPEDHYIFVAPVAAICAVVLRTGIFGAFVTAGLAYFVLIEPHWSLLGKETSGTIGLIAFIICGFIINAVTNLQYEAMQLANWQSEERRQIAQEINHRTKNNMMILAALLQTESRGLDPDVTLKDVLNGTARRLSVVGRVHDLLFREETGAVVEAEAFMRELCRSIESGLLTERVDLRLRVSAGQISMSHATTIGLLVNELVTNAVKHAFPGNEPGVITIELQCREGECSLVVADTGLGKPVGEFGFGYRMIATLVQQLEGRMHEQCEAGTRIEVVFPLRRAAKVAL